MVSLSVELGVRQYHPDARLLGSGLNDGGRIRTVVPGTASGGLRQQKLLVQVGHHDPLHRVPPGQRLLPVMTHPPHKEGADRSLCQSGGIHGHAGSPPALPSSPTQPAHRLADRLIDAHVVRTLRKVIQSREIRHARQAQGLTQFTAFVAHQTENGHQPPLRKLVLTETGSEPREHRPANLQGDADKGQETGFGHRTSCLDSKQQLHTAMYVEFSWS